MCGIVGYTGSKQAQPIVLESLKKLEYRGYDSSGIATREEKLVICKKEGPIVNMEAELPKSDSTLAIAHTRWATHGVPSDVNAHPHSDSENTIAVVHNGTIDNYLNIKENLEKEGYKFNSSSDSEVLPALIAKYYTGDLVQALHKSLEEIEGIFTIAVIHEDHPDEIVAVRNETPLVIGVGNSENYLASDIYAILKYTQQIIYPLDNQIVKLTSKSVEVFDDKLDAVDYEIEEVEKYTEVSEKGGFEHFMLKEIFEQPSAVVDTLRGRLKLKEGMIKLSGVDDYIDKFMSANKITIVACGTSWHAGLIAEYMFEKIAKIPVEVEYASEFRYRNPVIDKSDIVIAISQSGETADTLAAIKLAKKHGSFVYGICNVVGSTISRETDSGSYTHAGPEIGVASTKAFTTQITVLYLMAVKLSKSKGVISSKKYHEYIYELNSIKKKINKVLESNDKINKIATKIKTATNCLYLGRGYNFPVALEGALKLKEISYIHAEGYPAAEMKHGPIALIDKNMPSIIIATNKLYYDKILSNIQEIKSRKGKIIAVVYEGDKEISKIADYTIEVPETIAALTPFVTTIPLQLLSYHIAVKLGRNVDQPRNLAKSVTVE